MVIVGGPDGALRSLAEGALAAAGAKVFGAGDVTWPMLRTLIRALRLEGGTYAGGGALRFADRQGRALSARQQSAVSACVLRQDLPPAFDGSGEVTHLTGAEAVYLSALLPGDAGRETALPVLVCCASGPLRHLAAEALRRMGVSRVRTAETPPLPEPGETGFLLAPDGESVSLFTRDTVYAPEQTALLRLLLLHREQGKLYDLPGTPRAAEEISALQPPDGSDACAWQRTAAEDGLATMLLICRSLREKPLEAWIASGHPGDPLPDGGQGQGGAAAVADRADAPCAGGGRAVFPSPGLCHRGGGRPPGRGADHRRGGGHGICPRAVRSVRRTGARPGGRKKNGGNGKKTPRFRLDKMRRAAYNNTVEASWGVRQRSVFTHIS